MTDNAEEVPTASVVIINYNGRDFLPELLSSLEEQSYSDFETLLIDNQSQDDSVHYVETHFPGVRILPQTRNLGFSAAANLGWKEARGEFVAYLNTDMKVDRKWLATLLRPMRQQNVAAVASKMILYSEPSKLNGVGGCMNRLGYTWDRGMLETDEGQYDEPAEVLFASAGAALYRKTALADAGAFDEAMFMYHEDVDLGWRLWIIGYRIVTAPGAVVFHHFGGTTRETQGMEWRELMGERHNIRALLKNYQFRCLIRNLGRLLLLKQPIRRKWEQAKNFGWNLRHIGSALRLRRQLAAKRRRSDQELRTLIVQSSDVPVSF